MFIILANYTTVEPLKKGHFRGNNLEVVPISEVKESISMGSKQVSFVERSSLSQRVPYRRFHCMYIYLSDILPRSHYNLGQCIGCHFHPLLVADAHHSPYNLVDLGGVNYVLHTYTSWGGGGGGRIITWDNLGHVPYVPWVLENGGRSSG